MPATLAIMKQKILGILNKQPNYQGFYTNQKITDAINDSLDWIFANMMFVGQGWNKTIGYITTTPNTASYNLPNDTAVIDVVRYLINGTYIPLAYDEQSDNNFNTTDKTVHVPLTYRIVANQIFFNPIPTEVGTNYLQIEYTKYPAQLAQDSDVIDTAITRGLENYVKWRSCSILASQVGKGVPEWSAYENEWYLHMKELVAQRVRQTRFISEFRS